MNADLNSGQLNRSQDDLLWRHLKSVPAFRALLRSVEAQLIRQLDLAGPVLDLGCGDGHFASLTFAEPLAAGLDPWWGPLTKARRSGAYKGVLQGMGAAMPFPDGCFGTVISNSVLEHIPDVQPVLNDAARVLRPGGRLVITMPSDNFTARLGGAVWLENRGWDRLANRYRQAFNFVARHAHTDPPAVWAQRLAKAGFVVEHWQHYFSERALHALELGHFLGLPSLIAHVLTRRWIIAPWRSSLFLTERWLRPLYAEPSGADGTMILFVARREYSGQKRTRLSSSMSPNPGSS